MLNEESKVKYNGGEPGGRNFFYKEEQSGTERENSDYNGFWGDDNIY